LGLDLLSRPITYLAWDIESADGKPHQVQLYVDCGAEIAVNTPEQSVGLDYPAVEGLAVARMGTGDQPVLARRATMCGLTGLRVPGGACRAWRGRDGRERRPPAPRLRHGSALPAPAGPAAPAPVTESRLAMAASWISGRLARPCHPLGHAGL